jgi:hypothetical protein
MVEKSYNKTNLCFFQKCTFSKLEIIASVFILLAQKRGPFSMYSLCALNADALPIGVYVAQSGWTCA